MNYFFSIFYNLVKVICASGSRLDHLLCDDVAIRRCDNAFITPIESSHRRIATSAHLTEVIKQVFAMRGRCFFFEIILLTFFCCVFANAGHAQKNIAYVDADEVIKAMPEYRISRSELEIFQKQLLQQLDDEKRAIAVFYADVIERVKSGALTPKQQQDAEVELQKRQEVLELKKNEADQRLLAKEKSLSQPMYDKFEAALASVAKANKYQYIMDKKLLRYSLGGIDATEKMKKELGIRK